MNQQFPIEAFKSRPLYRSGLRLPCQAGNNLRCQFNQGLVADRRPSAGPVDGRSLLSISFRADSFIGVIVTNAAMPSVRIA